MGLRPIEYSFVFRFVWAGYVLEGIATGVKLRDLAPQAIQASCASTPSQTHREWFVISGDHLDCAIPRGIDRQRHFSSDYAA